MFGKFIIFRLTVVLFAGESQTSHSGLANVVCPLANVVYYSPNRHHLPCGKLLTDVVSRQEDVTFHLADVISRLADVTSRLADVISRVPDVVFRVPDVVFRVVGPIIYSIIAGWDSIPDPCQDNRR